MATGTVYPAKVALKALLEALTWPVDPTSPRGAPAIMWGAPTKGEEIAYQAVYFGDTDIADDFRGLAASRSDETYRLNLVVDVRDYGGEQDTEARAWQLHDAIISMLRENLTLNGAIKYISGYIVRQGNPVPDTEKWRTQIVIQPQCVGHIIY